jgi:hypothetical protein
LFTCILNYRLFNYLESLGLLCEEQAGFRKGYGTIDHIFNLKCLIDLYLFRRKKIYCAFIEYRKAFDSVVKILLWQKLLRTSIDGNLLIVIQNMYKNAKSCVRDCSNCSDFFPSNIGVRQGDYLSRLLFSVFLNDLAEFMSHAYKMVLMMFVIFHICYLTTTILKYILNCTYYCMRTIQLYLLKLRLNCSQLLMQCICTVKLGN